MSWSRRFFDPIPLPDGRDLVTLEDAGEFIQALPASKQKTEPWQAAAQALLLVVDGNGDPMLARIGMMLTLYPPGEKVFDKTRKDRSALGQAEAEARRVVLTALNSPPTPCRDRRRSRS